MGTEITLSRPQNLKPYEPDPPIFGQSTEPAKTANKWFFVCFRITLHKRSPWAGGRQAAKEKMAAVGTFALSATVF
jgi:hypothetical protein